MTIRELSYVLAAVVVLASCSAAGVRVGRDDVAHAYQPSELGVIGGAGNQLRVDVAGDPFQLGNAAFSETVVAAMQGRTPGYRVEFATAPVQEWTPRHRVVMLFDPAEGTIPRRLCSDPFATGAAEAGRVRVMAAFCRGGFPLTYASGVAWNVDGPQSDRFDALMKQMTMTLFPRNNRNNDEERCPKFVIACP